MSQPDEIICITPDVGTPKKRLARSKRQRTPKPLAWKNVRKTLRLAIYMNFDKKLLADGYRYVDACSFSILDRPNLKLDRPNPA